MLREGKPSPAGVILISLTGAEAALCLVALFSGSYGAFLPTVFPALLASASLVWPVLLLFRLSGVFHIVSFVVLFAGLCIQSFGNTSWTIYPQGKTVTMLLLLATPLLGTVSLYVAGELKEQALGQTAPPKAILSQGDTNREASEAQPRSEGCDILELPSSLDMSPRTTEKVSTPMRSGPVKIQISSPPRIGSPPPPFASLMAQHIQTKSAGSPRHELVRIPNVCRSPPMMMYSPYSTPNPNPRATGYLGGQLQDLV